VAAGGAAAANAASASSARAIFGTALKFADGFFTVTGVVKDCQFVFDAYKTAQTCSDPHQSNLFCGRAVAQAAASATDLRTTPQLGPRTTLAAPQRSDARKTRRSTSESYFRAGQVPVQPNTTDFRCL
jgi:hypothetical protein